MKKLTNIYNNIQKVVSGYTNINLAYLIGSYARNCERTDSDIDIVIVTNDASKMAYDELYEAIDRCIANKTLDLRIIVPKETDPIFLFEIVKDSVCLYSKSAHEKSHFEWYALKMYYDTQYLRDVYRMYLDKRFAQGTYGK